MFRSALLTLAIIASVPGSALGQKADKPVTSDRPVRATGSGWTDFGALSSTMVRLFDVVIGLSLLALED